MIGIEEAFRIAALRERLYRCVEDELNRDGHHKSYEGALDVTLAFPSIFDRGAAPKWLLTWHCYVVPEDGRHHTWTGGTLAEAIAVAESAAEKMAFKYEMERFSRSVEQCDDEEGEADGSRTIYGPGRDMTVPNGDRGSAA